MKKAMFLIITHKNVELISVSIDNLRHGHLYDLIFA